MAKLRNVALLTGAGFTKSFGGYLSREMWARIFNHSNIQNQKKLRECMLNQLNFEYAYAAVMETDNYNIKEKESFTEAVRDAFRNMHGKIFDPTNPNLEWLYSLFEIFLPPFGDIADECTMFFTLNQDLCVEVAHGHSKSTDPAMELLGIPKDLWFQHDIVGLLESDPILLPFKEDLEAMKDHLSASHPGGFIYVKLHGSYGWNKPDGSHAMVIGDLKSTTIAGEPLFTWYHEVFRDTLLNKGQKLIVIGYSFRDAHINKSIADGVSKGGLRLYIIDPMDPETLKQHLQSLPIAPDYSVEHTGDVIWGGLSGYYQCELGDLYGQFEFTPEGETFIEALGLIK